MARPNFLVFVTDQQRADHLGCYGNPVLRTPSIDALAARGTVFDRCYVASPVCMPNRAALATGRMPSAAGVRMNGVPLSLSARVYVEELRQAGWHTGLLGKCHLQNMTANPPAWARGLGGAPSPRQADLDERRGPEYEQESMRRWQDPSHRVSTPYYGFEDVELCIEHGDEVGGDYARWLSAEGLRQDELAGRVNALPTTGLVAPQAWRTAVTESRYPSAFIRDRAIAWLETHRAERREAPFYLQCSFPDPHHPFTPPGAWFDAYSPDEVDLPPSFACSNGDGMPLKRALHDERSAGRRATGSSRVIAVDETEARQAIALAYGSIALIDRMVGDVLAALDRLNLEEETVVLFLSDHGDFMGDHGLLFKGPLHYRSLVRMPLVWADPAHPPAQRREQLVSAIDVAPTILARAGMPAYTGIQGIDLGPILADGKRTTRDFLLIEEEGHRALPGANRLPKVRTLVSAGWRMSVHAGEPWGELYDLRLDPHELSNRWHDPALVATRAELLWRLVDQMASYADECPLPTFMA